MTYYYISRFLLLTQLFNINSVVNTLPCKKNERKRERIKEIQKRSVKKKKKKEMMLERQKRTEMKKSDWKKKESESNGQEKKGLK